MRCNTAKYHRRMKKQRANQELRRQTATVAEQDAMVEKAYEPLERQADERDCILDSQAEAARAAQDELEPVMCPLCKQEITVEDGTEKNVDVVEMNHRLYPVHKTCPVGAKHG